MRPERVHAYCYKDRRYVIAGHSIPNAVADQVYVAMRQAPFRMSDVEKFCEHALRDHNGPISACFQLASRIVRDCRDSRQIVIKLRENRFNVWEWVDV